MSYFRSARVDRDRERDVSRDRLPPSKLRRGGRLRSTTTRQREQSLNVGEEPGWGPFGHVPKKNDPEREIAGAIPRDVDAAFAARHGVFRHRF